MNAPKAFRKKPVEIQAILYTGDNGRDVGVFVGEADRNEKNQFLIHTREGTMAADVGDWVIRGVAGEFYPCKPDIFAQTYEAVDDSAADRQDSVRYRVAGPGRVFILDGAPAPTVGVNVVGFAEESILAGLAAIQRCRCWNRELGPCEIPEHRDLAEQQRKKNGPWRTAAEVPDDVRFIPQSRLLRHGVFKRTARPDEYAALSDYTLDRGFRIWDEDAVDELAPFVRADGDRS